MEIMLHCCHPPLPQPHSMVKRLPPEILSQIFVFHAQIECPWLGAALTSTHVCRRWREIGLSCPSLWSHIDCDDCHSVTWMATMIERSRSVPLSLVITEETDMCSQKVALVANNMHRFKMLDLDIPETNTESFFELFSKPVPILQEVEVYYYGESAFAFPSKFLTGDAPNLRHITLLTNSHVPWDSGLFANLVTLDIHGNEENGDYPDPPPFEMLLSALVKMPGLEILHLRDCFPLPSGSDVKHIHASLPNLSQLWAMGPLISCTHFLKRITVNAITQLVIKCSRVYKADLDEFFTVFPSRLCAASPPIAQTLEYTWNDHRNFRVDLWTVQQHTEVKSPHNPNIKLVFCWESNHTRGISPLDLTWICFAALASPLLRSFRITDSDDVIQWDVEVWKRLARLAPGLQQLAPGTEAQCRELCKVLYPPDGLDLVPADCCLPALSHLELYPHYSDLMSTPDGGDCRSEPLMDTVPASAV